MRAAWSIAVRDLRELVRDGRLRIVVGCTMVVLTVAVAGGAMRSARAAAERQEAQEAERDRWLDQGDVNPHAAAHYGTFVFAPVEPLAMLDPGVLPFVGAVVFLEAHQQQLARYRPIEDAASSRRLGALSVASALQLFVPLFIVLLAGGAVTRERERGTWRLLLASGVTPWRLVGGKLLGVLLSLALIVLPATVLAVVILLAAPGVPLDTDSLVRGLLLALAYAVHLLTWLFLATAISLWARSSRQALAVALALWLAVGIIAPPALLAIASARPPAPTAAEFGAAIDDERARRPSWDERVEAATTRFLTGEELPPASNPEVVALIETEEDDTELYARHLDALAQVFATQSGRYATLSALSPSAAIQVLSMGLAATDAAHYRHFLEAAAAYRTVVLGTLNRELAAFDSWKTFNAAGSRDLWLRVPEFDYETPAVGWAMYRLWEPLAGVALWMAMSVVVLWRAATSHGGRP